MLILKNINKKEVEEIQKGHFHLLRDKLEEAEKSWTKQLMQGKEDHRHTQGICCILDDLLNLLPKK